MTDEANIAEAELAKVLLQAENDWTHQSANHRLVFVARALLAAGYRKRSDVLEECEAAIESVVECCTAYVTDSVMRRLDVQYAPKRDYHEAIRSLKDKP